MPRNNIVVQPRRPLARSDGGTRPGAERAGGEPLPDGRHAGPLSPSFDGVRPRRGVGVVLVIREAAAAMLSLVVRDVGLECRRA